MKVFIVPSSWFTFLLTWDSSFSISVSIMLISGTEVLFFKAISVDRHCLQVHHTSFLSSELSALYSFVVIPIQCVQ